MALLLERTSRRRGQVFRLAPVTNAFPARLLLSAVIQPSLTQARREPRSLSFDLGPKVQD
jgi:hypothetical protein